MGVGQVLEKRVESRMSGENVCSWTFLKQLIRRPLTQVEEEEDFKRALELSLASSTPSTPAPKLTPAPGINSVAVC